MKIFIGIDDTDNLHSRGTGYQARTLGQSLVDSGLFKMQTVVRHQLLVDPRIPFTSHNSSASITGICLGKPEDLISHAREFLLRESAFDADAGLCVGFAEDISPETETFGKRAKSEILSMDEAFRLASESSLYLEGFLNTRMGVIGSLAAVGLRAGGNDGRLLWLPNLRETTGDFTVRELMELIGIDRVIEKNFTEPGPDAVIRIHEWCRPVMVGGKISLIIEKSEKNQPYEYQSASKDFIKSISE